MELRILQGLNGLDPETWDTLVGEESPFLEWGWLASLEDSGCVDPESGWLPQHLTLWEGDRLIGACPLYVKGHSQGEFVFDHGWAEAAHRAGLRYFPKLLVAVPFTPATGARFLYAPGIDRGTVLRTLGQALRGVCAEQGFSSVHVNFCLDDELGELEGQGFLGRVGYQYQWRNPGWESFEDYLSAFRSKRRVQIKRELRELESQGVSIETLSGEEIPEELFDVMFLLYKTTIDKLPWGHQYLNQELFRLLAQRWRKRLVFTVATRAGRVVAGTFMVRKGEVLYGRYWGAFEELRYLHFNVCYYASIAHCLRAGIRRFEPGAGGEFKHLRGFDAFPTVSAHHLADPRLRRAVADFLERERRSVREQIDWLGERSSLKPPT